MKAFTDAIERVSAPGQHWLDAGCGTGELSEFLRGIGREVTAVDASPEMIKLCKVPATLARLEKLPFSEERFDGVVCSSVLEYLDSPELALQEFRRVLKPEAYLLISVPNSRSLLRAVQLLTYALLRTPRYMEFSRHAYSEEKFNCMLRAHGFRPEAAHCFGSTLLGGKHVPFGYTLRLHVASRNTHPGSA